MARHDPALEKISGRSRRDAQPKPCVAQVRAPEYLAHQHVLAHRMHRATRLRAEGRGLAQPLPQRAARPGAATVIWIRWIRESINSLLPVAGIGGDVASGRLAHLRGVPGAQAAASMVVDTTVGVATQLIFVVSGTGLLLMRSSERSAVV